MRVLCNEHRGISLIKGKEYEVECLYGNLYGILDETDGVYAFPPEMFTVIEALPVPETIELKYYTLEEAKQLHPECFALPAD